MKKVNKLAVFLAHQSNFEISCLSLVYDHGYNMYILRPAEQKKTTFPFVYRLID